MNCEYTYEFLCDSVYALLCLYGNENANERNIHTNTYTYTTKKKSDMRGLLLIPLWSGARFWASAFRDGRHANRVFTGVEVRRVRTFAWRRTERDQIGGKSMRFLVLHFVSTGTDAVKDGMSEIGQRRCIRRIFDQDCFC
jgi:hypothetical protein